MTETPRLENVVIFFQIIKLTNQLIQRRTRDRNGIDNNNSYF